MTSPRTSRYDESEDESVRVLLVRVREDEDQVYPARVHHAPALHPALLAVYSTAGRAKEGPSRHGRALHGLRPYGLVIYNR